MTIEPSVFCNPTNQREIALLCGLSGFFRFNFFFNNAVEMAINHRKMKKK
jgi:hypothetical protein